MQNCTCADLNNGDMLCHHDAKPEQVWYSEFATVTVHLVYNRGLDACMHGCLDLVNMLNGCH